MDVSHSSNALENSAGTKSLSLPSTYRWDRHAYDMIPDLQHPKNPLLLLEPGHMPKAVPANG